MVKVHLQEDLAIVRFRDSTRLIHEFSNELQPQLLAISDHNVKNVLINMGNVSVIDSFGIGEIVRLARTLFDKKNNVAFSNIGGQVLKRVEMLGLDKDFTIYETEDEALKSMLR